MEAIFLLVCIGLLLLWVFAGVRMSAHGGSKGTKQFFAWLGGCLFVIALVFVVLVVPTLDCSGWLCGLGELLLFMLITAIILLVTPILLMTVAVSKLKKNNPAKGIQEDELIA